MRQEKNLPHFCIEEATTMKRYLVTIECQNGRKNQLIEWAETEDEAKARALKAWGNPTIWKAISAVDTKY